jgi:hypothetical protein
LLSSASSASSAPSAVAYRQDGSGDGALVR